MNRIEQNRIYKFKYIERYSLRTIIIKLLEFKNPNQLIRKDKEDVRDGR